MTGVHTSPSKLRVLTIKRHCMEPILCPRAPNAPIFGGACSSQCKLSKHPRVHCSNSRQKPGVARGSLKNGVLTLKRHCVEPILCPRAPNAPIFGGACRLQPGLSGHTRVHCSNSRQKPGVAWGCLKTLYIYKYRDLGYPGL